MLFWVPLPSNRTRSYGSEASKNSDYLAAFTPSAPTAPSKGHCELLADAGKVYGTQMPTCGPLHVLLCPRENHEMLCKPWTYLSSLPVETKAYCYLRGVGYVAVLIVPRGLRTRADARPWARGQMAGHGFRGQLGGASQLKTELQWSLCETRRPMGER